MRRLILQVALLFFSILISWKGIAQCPGGTITIQSQEDVDYYAANFPNCTEWPYGITIFQPAGEDYTSLDFFGNITSLGDALTVKGNANYLSAFTNLQSLEGSLNIEEIDGGVVEIPNSITYISGHFRVENCSNLSVLGLTDLTELGGSLIISECINLEFNALSNLQTINRISIDDYSGSLDFSSVMPALQTVETNVVVGGMETADAIELPNSISSIGGEVWVSGCENFTMGGLEGVTALDENVRIVNSSNVVFNALPNVEVIDYLILEESSDINFAEGLQSLETIETNLFIGNCSGDMDFWGLESLQNINNAFWLSNCDNDISIYGLNCGSYVEDIHIFNNDGGIFTDWGTKLGQEVGSVLISNSGLYHMGIFSNVETINGSFSLHDAPFLQSGEGLSNISSIGAHFMIDSAPQLTQFNPVSVQEIGGWLQINGIDGGNSQGFADLISVGGGMEIFDMPNLLNFENLGFSNLESIGSDLSIYDMGITSILNLSELTNLDGWLQIFNCPNLNSCEIPYICENMFGGSIDLAENGFSCSSLSNIDCSGQAEVEGQVFADLDCDGIQGPNEQGIPVHMILGQNDLIGFTNSAGDYSVNLDINEDYEIAVAPLFGFDNDTTYFFTPTSQFQSLVYDFPMCPTGGEVSNMSVSVTPIDAPMPGFSNQYEICVANLGSQIASGYLSFEISGFNGATIFEAGGGSIDENIANWSTSVLEPFESECFVVVVQIESTGTLGHTFESVASIEMDGSMDDDLSNNTHTVEQTVLGSFDPNDKQVNHELIDVGNYENDSLFTLEYLIRFQNTGTAPATFVRVKDYLPPELNPATIEMIHASHDYELSYEPEGTVFDTPPKLEWFFDDINLPDSTSNEPESHGFIHFRISTYPNIEPGDVIENFASIYFDYNVPVITEDAVTHFVECDDESLAINIPDQVCVGDTIPLTASLPDFDSYTWTVEGNEFSGGQQVETAFFSSGDLALTITNETCTLSTSLEIEVKAQPELNLQPEPYVSCDSEIEMDLSANGQVSWFYGDSLLASGNTTTLAQSGIYNITNENECGMIEGQLEVVLHQLNLEEPELICENDPVALEPDFEGYDSFSWIVEGEQYTGDSISVAFAGDGSVELQASSAFCADTTFLNFEVLPQPSMNVVLEPYVGCFGEVQIDLDAVGLVNWWLDGGIINIGDPVTLQESGTYDVTVANACNTIENVVSVEVYDIPAEVTLTFDGEQLVVSPEGSDYVWLLDGLPVSTEGPAFTPTESGDYTVIVYFEGSMCSQTSNMVFVPVSINEQLAQQIQIHPNPTRDFVTIQLPQGEWTISLLNPKGQVLQVHEKVTDTKFQLDDLQDLAPGLYFVNVQSVEYRILEKLVVE